MAFYMQRAPTISHHHLTMPLGRAVARRLTLSENPAGKSRLPNDALNVWWVWWVLLWRCDWLPMTLSLNKAVYGPPLYVGGGRNSAIWRFTVVGGNLAWLGLVRPELSRLPLFDRYYETYEILHCNTISNCPVNLHKSVAFPLHSIIQVWRVAISLQYRQLHTSCPQRALNYNIQWRYATRHATQLSAQTFKVTPRVKFGVHIDN